MTNLGTRVIVAVIAIPLIIAITLLGSGYFFALTTAIVIFSLSEFYDLASKKGIMPSKIMGLTAAGVLNGLIYSSGFTSAEIFLLLIIGTVLLNELFRRRTDKVEKAFENTGVTILGLFYIGIFGSTLTAMRERISIESLLPTYLDGGILILMLFATIWICDSAAYFVGKAIGQHKMSGIISPNKTWEGAIAGFIFAILSTTLAKYLVMRQLSILAATGIGIIVGVFGQAGDFVESLFKRDVGQKDSSQLIPGHGGVFDRFDSLIFSAPFVYLWLLFLSHNL
ncbi:MAG: phosphatidate cytidylyltransferase [Candidatus Kryptoniota bacterium]